MSLVVLSNQPQDAQSSRNRNSISKPWSFKNTLTSTYEVPADAQVALTSCKVNIPERVIVGGNGNKFYQYIGVKRDLGGANDQSFYSTSWPVQVRLTEDDSDSTVFEELSPADFAARLQSRIRATTYHPNYKNKAIVTRALEASTNKFTGYSITYDQSNSAANASHIPTSAFKQWFSSDSPYTDTAQFKYNNGTKSFSRIDTSGSSTHTVCAGINPQYPLSLTSGEFVVNVSGTAAGNANASAVEWHVGLSRYVHKANFFGEYKPAYDQTQNLPDGSAGDVLHLDQNIYADFAVARNTEGDLVVYQYVVDDQFRFRRQEVKYWLNASSVFAGTERFSLVGEPYGRVKFEVEGEVVSCYLYDDVGKNYDLITKYQVGKRDDSYFKPVNQCCWTLHPVLAIGRKTGAESCTLQFKEYQGMDITGYDPTVKNGGGWYENNLVINRDIDSNALDIRPVNGSGGGSSKGASYVQKESNASGGIDYKPVLILGPNLIYNRDASTEGANAQDLLGYDKSVVETATTIQGSLDTFKSTITPALGPQYSMFCRLNNFGQETTNGWIGNRSKIIAHLTTFENATGKLTHDPANLIYLDLNNSMPLNITEFDISFCYVNEQFAEVLTGQSICTLHIRKKPKELQ